MNPQYSGNPGAPGGPAGPAGGQVNNYMVPAILSIFCCWPLAIVAIINAAQVNSQLAAGNYAGAVASSANAKRWSTIAIVIGVIILVLYILLVVVFGVAAFSFSAGTPSTNP